MRYLLIIVTFAVSIVAQPHSGEKRDFGRRFHELEKLKLLEFLDMDEETAIKFFSRRKSMKNNTKTLFERADKIYLELENLIGQSNDKQEIRRIINESIKIEEEIFKERKHYLDSVSEILDEEQIARLILFEKKFRNDIRDLLIERGRKRFFKRNNNIIDN